MGRVPYGPEPDIFDFYRFTSPGTRLFSDAVPAPAPAYFSIDGGVKAIADYGVNSDPSDFLNTYDTPPSILKELNKIAFANLGDYIDTTGNSPKVVLTLPSRYPLPRPSRSRARSRLSRACP